MDLLYVGDVPPFPGGAGISMFQILAGLAGRGHEIRALGVITPEKWPEGARFAASQPVEIHWIELDRYSMVRNVLPDRQMLEEERVAKRGSLLTLIHERRPDVVIVGQEYWATHVVGAAVEQALPVVVLVRGNPGRGIVLGTYPSEAAAEVLSALQLADEVVCVANYLRRGLERLGVSRASTIYNAVDHIQFSPTNKPMTLMQSFGIQERDVVVGHFSNHNPLKRTVDIVDSAPLALREFPNLVYLIVGDGVTRAECEARCVELGLSDRFRFLGWTEYSAIPELMNLTDIVVMPSGGEGMSRVYLEAQACGRVLLASDIDAAHEVIQPGVTGLMFAVGDPADLARQTVLAATDPELRRSIGVNARRQIEDRHTLERAVDAYEAMLSRVVARGREEKEDNSGG